MPKCLNDPSKTYRGNEPSPKGLGYCAHGEDIGCIKKGLNENQWIVVELSNGTKRWKNTGNIAVDNSINKVEIKDNYYHLGELRALRISDHHIKSLDSRHPALFIANSLYLKDTDVMNELCSNLEMLMKKLYSKRLEHPNSFKKVWDLIHPSHYPLINGISQNLQGSKFEITEKYKSYKKERKQDFYLSRFQIFESKYKWIPTIFNVSRNNDTLEIVQKSYINDLFIEDQKLKQDIEIEICKAFGYAYLLFSQLGIAMFCPYNNFSSKDLQVVVKSAYYELNPGETHEGVWHVEGMPDEHIIMSSILYYQDDFEDATLELRRDVSEKEEKTRMMILPQNTVVDNKDSMLQEHLGYMKTEKGMMYAWPNSCQHRLMELKNTGTSIKKRSFIAFFLIDPDVKIVDTSMIKPQHKYINDEDSITNMVSLMEERRKVKVVLNKEVMSEISYCEH